MSILKSYFDDVIVCKDIHGYSWIFGYSYAYSMGFNWDIPMAMEMGTGIVVNPTPQLFEDDASATVSHWAGFLAFGSSYSIVFSQKQLALKKGCP